MLRTKTKIIDVIRNAKNTCSKREASVNSGVSWGAMYKIVDTLLAEVTFSPRNSPNFELELDSFNGGNGYGSKTLFYRADCKQAA